MYTEMRHPNEMDMEATDASEVEGLLSGYRDTSSRSKCNINESRGHHRDIALSIALPWVMFSLLLLLFLFYWELKCLVWCLVCLCGLGAVALVCLGMAARHGCFLLLGAASFASVLAAVIVGLHVNKEYLSYYRTVHNGSVHKSVDPSENAAGTADAGVLEFMPGTLVDDLRTIGFVAGGRIHCVAPVAKEGLYNQAVEYWASGVNCCEKRSHFDCGTAMELDLHSKMAIVSRPSKYFGQAVKEALSVYNLTTSSDNLLVTFVHSPDQEQDGIWDSALHTILVAALVHLCGMFVLVHLVFKAVPDSMAPEGGEAYVRHYLFER